MTKTTMIAAAMMLAGVSGAAQAQAKTCRGKVFMDSVYQTATGSGYEYFVQVRNQTDTPMHWTLHFSKLPPGVTVFSQELSGTVAAHESVKPTIRFGKGSNGNINVQTVSTGYDSAAPMISLINCY